jgi:hypothetical protein
MGTVVRPLQAEMGNNETITQRLVFIDGTTFFTCGKIKVHNLHLWGTENHATLHHQRYSPEVNVYSAI